MRDGMTPVNASRKTENENNGRRKGEIVTYLTKTTARVFDIADAEINLTCSFAEFGGNSLLAYRLAEQISADLKIDCSVATFLSYASLAEIFDDIGETVIASDSQAVIPPLVERPLLGSARTGLSYCQKGLLFMSEFLGSIRPFLLIEGIVLEGITDLKKLLRSIRHVISHCDAFWQALSYEQGTAFIKVAGVRDFQIGFADVSMTAEPLQAAQERALAIFNKEFDLATAPNFALDMCRIGVNAYTVFLALPHIFFDGWSVEEVFENILSAYRADRPASPLLSIDAAAVEQAYLDSQRAILDRNYFNAVLNAGGTPVLSRYRKSNRMQTGAAIEWEMPQTDYGSLDKLSRETGCSIYAVLLAAASIVLGRFAGQDRLVIGTPFANRLTLKSISGSAAGVSCLVNLVPLTLDLSGDWRMEAYWRNVQVTVADAFEHQGYPFEKLVADLGDASHDPTSPVFDFVLTYWSHKERCRISSYGPHQRRSLHLPVAKYPAELICEERRNTISFCLRYCPDVIDREIVQTFARCLAGMLGNMERYRSRRLQEIGIVPEDDVHALIAMNDRTSVQSPVGESLWSLFERQAITNPQAVAVVDDDGAHTYSELYRRSNGIAAALWGKGARRGDKIAILQHRCFELIASTLAVLSIGCAYVPLDPSHPRERKAFILDDSNAKTVLASRDLIEDGDDKRSWLAVEDLVGIASMPAARPQPGDLAYVIYTSGTTGLPKGVMVGHDNVVRLLFNDETPFNFAASDTWSMYHAHCFDVSVWEIFGALLTGARLVIVSETVARDPAQFRDLLCRERVTVLSQTPTAFYNLSLEEERRQTADLSVRIIVFAGEALDPSRLAFWRRRYASCALCNMYGITETTVHTTYHFLGDDDIRNRIGRIGGPLPTLSMYAVDQHLHPVPAGVWGEIIVGGAGVTKGYLNRPELTRQRFLLAWHDRRGPFYRSGDVAYQETRGGFVYIGRNDNQVKIRGYRIELDEIAVRLMAIDGVEDALVMPMVSDRGTLLYAYWIGGGNADDIRKALQQTLPDYMVPHYLINIERFPLTINGKIDRAKLPRPQARTTEGRERDPPANERERWLFDIFAQVLGHRNFGTGDDFYAIGGDSLLAAQVVSLAERRIGVLDIYRRRNIKELAKCNDANKSFLSRLTSPPASGSKRTYMLCVPFGGGNATTYVPLAEAIARRSNEWEVLGVTPSGFSGNRVEHRPDTDFGYIAAQIVGDIGRAGEPIDGCVVFSYCVGVGLGLELVKQLHAANVPIKAIVVAAKLPPSFDPRDPRLDYWSSVDDDALKAQLEWLGMHAARALPAPVLQDFRHDVHQYRRYFWSLQTKGVKRLACPAYLVFGENDSETAGFQETSAGWNAFFDIAGTLALAGAGHYFLENHAETIAQYLLSRVRDL